jgi:hypothetical protein
MSEALTKDDRGEARVFFELTLLALAWSLVAWLMWQFIESSSSSTGELAEYRRAGAAFIAGTTPDGTRETGMPLSFSPLAFLLFGWLARVPAQATFWIWLLGKAGCLVVLLRVAQRHFEPFRHHFGSLAFLTFAFNGALYAGVTANGFTLAEQALFWSAVGAYLNARYALFLCFTVLGSQLNPTPALVLLLLPVALPRQSWRWSAVAAGGLVAALVLEGFVWPAVTRDFLHGFLSFDEAHVQYPTSYAVANDVARLLAGVDPLWSHLTGGIYVAIALGVVFFTRFILSAHQWWLLENPAWCVAFIVCAYALVAPGLGNSSYIMLIIPAWLVVRRVAPAYCLAWLPLLIGLPNAKGPLPISALATRAVEFVPWVAAVAVFLAVGSYIRNQAAMAPVQP